MPKNQKNDSKKQCCAANWKTAVDVRSFVFEKITPYNGNASFLQGPTTKTKNIWKKCLELIEKEKANGGVLDIDTDTIPSITAFGPGYIDKKNEVIVGLQTDAPLKRAIKPFGGIRMVEHACQEYGKKVNDEVVKAFHLCRKTHNDGVFDAYTDEMRKLRKTGVLTGLPDAYGRGRIIGDYRRVALYGTAKLIEQKEKDKQAIETPMTDTNIQLREELSEQIKALKMMTEMAKSYGFDISRPAESAQEAIQWTYLAFLSALKEQDGAAMSLGNVSNFFDIFIEKDLKAKKITEVQAQELVDQFVIKLRLVRHLRTSEYNQLFAGDPTWMTESLGGLWQNGKHKVTKTSYRFLQTLYNLGPSPEPNLTILWSEKLPKTFKEFCAKVSIETSSIQYENDDLMRTVGCSDDYGISCCVSRLATGKQMQFFGARCNLAKALLLALNEGKDEMTGIQIVPGIKPLKGKYLKYEEVLERFKISMSFLANAYVDTMNIIHFMHDKYYYERAQMALLDTRPQRLMAFGVAGFSVTTDSLSAIKYAKVKPIRNEQSIAVDFEIQGDYPKYGNDNNKVDNIGKNLVKQFYQELKKHHIYRNATPTLSVLTITSNVVYGHKTGATPDGRKAGASFAPGANPMHGRDTAGAIASLNSVAKINYQDAQDGVSNTFTVTPQTIGANLKEQVANLTGLLDGYFSQQAHHLNVNVLNKKTLEDAMEHPELYPQLTIRVSGYAVNFVKLSREQQQEVLARTFFNTL